MFSHKDQNANVMGISSSDNSVEKKGVSVQVKSTSGTWDMYQYLCKTKDECLSDLFSGYSSGSVSGGASDNVNIYIEALNNWKDYEYLKIFVRPGWGSDSSSFNVTNSSSELQAIRNTINYKGASHNIVLIPLENMLSGMTGTINFSN